MGTRIISKIKIFLGYTITKELKLDFFPETGGIITLVNKEVRFYSSWFYTVHIVFNLKELDNGKHIITIYLRRK